MERFRNTITSLVAAGILLTGASYGQTNTRYLITNNDNSQGNSATFYSIGAGGSLTQTAVVPTGGFGWDGLGAVVTNKINVSHDANGDCAYLSDYVSVGGFAHPDVTAIAVDSLTVVGNFQGSSTDQVFTSGMGLASNSSHLYADFSGTQTIGTYTRMPGCQLQFVSDISAVGLAGGTIQGMKAGRKKLVVTYTDGSIESFNIANGVPVPNGDLQYSTAHQQSGYNPSAIDITADGHYAIFGDRGDTVEVSDISSGQLAPTVVYSGVATGDVVGGLALSPNESYLYITDFSNAKVSAATFDATTGAVTAGCTSATLNGYPHLLSFVASVVTAVPRGTGTGLFTADPGARVSVLHVSASGGTCSLTEIQNSPFDDSSNTETLESIGVFPPRHF